MTIPIIPGPFTGLGQGLQAGIGAYNAEKDKQYQEALRGSQFIYNLIQTGQLDPSVLGQQNTQATMGAAKIPVPEAGNILPSIPGMKARGVAQQVASTAPGSPQQMMTLDIQGRPAQVAEEDVSAALDQIRLKAAQGDEAAGRIMAKVLPPGAAQGLEKSQLAAIDAKHYTESADRFAAQAYIEAKKTGEDLSSFQPIAKKAYALAAADPEYADMVKNGQISQEYFSQAAERLYRMDENQRIAYLSALARARSAQDDLKSYYNYNLQGYDRQISDLERQKEKAALTPAESMVWLPKALTKDKEGKPLEPQERVALDKYKAAYSADTTLTRVRGERQDYADRFVQARTAPIGQPGAPAERRAGGAGAAAAAGAGLSTGVQSAARITQAAGILKGAKDKTKALQQLEESPFSESEKDAIAKEAGVKRAKKVPK